MGKKTLSCVSRLMEEKLGALPLTLHHIPSTPPLPPPSSSRDHPLDFYHEMVSLVNTTIGDDPALFKNEVSGSTPQGEGREGLASF